MTTNVTTRTDVLIIGAGISGIGIGKSLVRENMLDFIILESSDDFGGTWNLNRYPGCACDVPTELYSFADEPWPWKRLYSGWNEIHEYLVHVAHKYGLQTHTEFGKNAYKAHWDDQSAKWHVYTREGDHYEAKYLISGIGALNIPFTPAFEGLEDFQGVAMHSARWDSSVNLTGKDVAVIGTGASAIQIVPEIIDQIGSLTLYQRTPPWVIPNFNWKYSRLTRAVLEHVPGARRLLRNSVFLAQETLGLGMTRFPGMLGIMEKLGKWNIRRAFPDKPQDLTWLVDMLTPNWRLGCKRLLKSNGWYPALADPKTSLMFGTPERFTKTGIVCGNFELNHDVVIFATGFHVSDAISFMDIKGKNGVDLGARWDTEGMQALRGITVADMPNMFFMLGPNTGYGHNSVWFNIDCQTRYIMQLIKAVETGGGQTIEPKREAQDRYNQWLQRDLRGTVWDKGGCNSWYYDKNGENRVLFSDIATTYWLKTRSVKLSEYVIS